MVSEITAISPELSARRLDTSGGIGRILAAILILDDTIQMITGIHDMHYLASPAAAARAPVKLVQVVRNKFAMYSLLSGAHRPKRVRLSVQADSDNLTISYCAPLIEYIMAVLLDNACKFTIEEGEVMVRLQRMPNATAILSVSNYGASNPSGIDLFALGAKGVDESPGFGYGLHWAKLLVARYNEDATVGSRLEIEYTQDVSSAELSFHTFRLSGIVLTTGEVFA